MSIIKGIKMQTKKDSHLEVSANQISGVVGGYLIVYFIFPLFQHLEQYIVDSFGDILTPNKIKAYRLPSNVRT